MSNAEELNWINNIEGPTSRASGGKFQVKGSTDKNKASNQCHEGSNKTQGPPGVGREQDQYLPIANVVRIMRRTLPPHAKVADDAKEMLQECVSDFINFVTSEANEACQQEHRKTIIAEDLIGAMAWLGFDHYVEPLMIYLQKYRESEMLPMISRSNITHGGNPDRGYYSSVPMSGPTGPMHLTDEGLPPFAVVHPHYAVCASAMSGGKYHDGSGIGSGTNIVALDSSTKTIHGNGPSVAPGINGGSNGSVGEASPSSSTSGRSGFYNPYAQYK